MQVYLGDCSQEGSERERERRERERELAREREREKRERERELAREREREREREPGRSLFTGVTRILTHTAVNLFARQVCCLLVLTSRWNLHALGLCFVTRAVLTKTAVIFIIAAVVVVVAVYCLLNDPATCKCISETDLRRQSHALPK